MFKPLLLLCFSVLLIVEADACNCPQKEPMLKAFEHASVVFLGEVTEVKHYSDYSEAVFKVETIWKGHIDYQISVRSYNSDCKWQFAKNMSYKVYAYAFDNDVLLTDRCSRTNFLFEVKKDSEEMVGGFNFSDNPALDRDKIGKYFVYQYFYLTR